jgi:hypothetical protein
MLGFIGGAGGAAGQAGHAGDGGCGVGVACGGSPGTASAGGAGASGAFSDDNGGDGALGMGGAGGGNGIDNAGGGGGGGLYGGGGGAAGQVGSGSGGGGGGGSSGFATSVTNTSVGADATGTPSITFTYTAAPANTAAPAINGIPAVGHTLSCTQGLWSGTAPIGYAYQWQRDGSTSIATSSDYTVSGGDAGHLLSCQVTAANSAGSVSATSAGVQIPAAAPANTAAPAIDGIPAVGHTLSCTQGLWSGTAPIGYAYQWLTDGTRIPGATGSSYNVAEANLGQALTCQVTATNIAGSSSATSPSVRVTSTSAQTLGSASAGQAKVHNSAASVLVHCKGSLGSKCRLTATLTVIETTKTVIVVGTAKITLAGGEIKPLRVKLNATGRRLLAANHKLRIRLKIAQTGTAGSTAVSTQTLHIRV